MEFKGTVGGWVNGVEELKSLFIPPALHELGIHQ